MKLHQKLLNSAIKELRYLLQSMTDEYAHDPDISKSIHVMRVHFQSALGTVVLIHTTFGNRYLCSAKRDYSNYVMCAPNKIGDLTSARNIGMLKLIDADCPIVEPDVGIRLDQQTFFVLDKEK